MNAWAFQTAGRVCFGAGVCAQIAGELHAMGVRRVLLVTDPGVRRAGIAARVQRWIEAGDLQVTVFDQVEPDPSIKTVVKAAAAARAAGVDGVVGVGGGSPMDVAKVVAVILANKEPLATMFGIDTVRRPGLPQVMVPTTAGTGSEVTHIAILSDEAEKLKKGIVSRHLLPRLALVDPELTLGVPAAVTAASGMDALLHAVEALTSNQANMLSDTLARQAIGMIYPNLRTAVRDGSQLEARTAMSAGSTLAGMAFAQTGVTAVHAFAYPIGAEYHIPHGVANSLMMGPVLAFNVSGNPAKFAQVAAAFGLDAAGLTDEQAGDAAIAAMRTLAADIGIPDNLRQFGVTDADIDHLAASVMKVTRLLANNPRPVTLDDARRLYRAVL